MIDLSPVFLAAKERLEAVGVLTALGLQILDPEDHRLPMATIHFGPKPAEFDADTNPVETAQMQITVQYIDQVDIENPLIDLCAMAKKIDDALFKKSPCSGADTLENTAIEFTKSTLDMVQPTSWGRVGIVEFTCNVFLVAEEE